MTESNKAAVKITSISPLSKIDVVVESAKNKPDTENTAQSPRSTDRPVKAAKVHEFGGRGGLEPTRFGDWEKNGRCIDF